MTQAANDYANALLDRLADAGSDDEIVAICKETEAAVKKLKTVHPPRFHHIVNFVQLRRKDFARKDRRKREQENKKQQELW